MLILLLASFVGCHSYYIALDPNSAPFLRTWDGYNVDWSSGPVAALTDTAVAVRVNSRGVHFYQHDVSPWKTGIPCKRHRTALCETHNGSLVFPELEKPRYHYGTDHCGIDSRSRLVTNSTDVYDISQCDLAQGQLDLLYWRDQLFYSYRLYLPEWAYILTAVAVLYLVISLGQNVACIMGDQDAVTMPLLTECICLAQIILILALHCPMKIFVADHDRFMFWLVLSYILIYLIRHAFELVFERYVYTFNVITATLMFVTARLYCSFETPYSMILFILLMTRLSHKIYLHKKTRMESLTVCADAILLASHYRYSFRYAFWDIQLAPLYMVAIAVTCLIVGDITATIAHKTQKS